MKNFEILLKIVDKLNKEFGHAGGGKVDIDINPQHLNYHTVEEELKDRYYGENDEENKECKYKCIKSNTIINVHLYPTTLVGFYNCFSDNIEDAASLMIEALKNDTDEVKKIVQEVLNSSDNGH